MLGEFPELAVCEPGDLQAVAAAARTVSLPADWVFVHEGTPADACYVLLRGYVQVLRGGIELTTCGPGALLGEMALLGRTLRRASVVTRTPVLALRLEHDAVAALLAARPRLAECVSAAYDRHRTADTSATGS